MTQLAKTLIGQYRMAVLTLNITSIIIVVVEQQQ